MKNAARRPIRLNGCFSMGGSGPFSDGRCNTQRFTQERVQRAIRLGMYGKDEVLSAYYAAAGRSSTFRLGRRVTAVQQSIRLAIGQFGKTNAIHRYTWAILLLPISIAISKTRRFNHQGRCQPANSLFGIQSQSGVLGRRCRACIEMETKIRYDHLPDADLGRHRRRPERSNPTE